MKKYFGNKKEWTIEELKTLVNNNPALGFYWSSIERNGEITIHNWNNGFKGRNSRDFVKTKRGTFICN